MRASLIVRREVQLLNGQPWLHDDGEFYPVLDPSQKHFADIEQAGTYSLHVDTLANTADPFEHQGAHHPLFVTLHPGHHTSHPFAYYGTSVHEIAAFIDNPYLTVETTAEGERLLQGIRFQHSGLLPDRLYWLLGHLSTDFWYHLTSLPEGDCLSVKPSRTSEALVPVLRLHCRSCSDLALAFARFQHAVKQSWNTPFEP